VPFAMRDFRLMPRHDELSVLMRTARQLAKLCRDGAALVAEARDRSAPEQVMAAARSMHSELLSTKHALVTWVLDCERRIEQSSAPATRVTADSRS
jgi:hypothetical protein